MRTTIDLPDDLHQLARQLAHENNQSMSEVVVALAQRPITAEDVRLLDDE